MITVEKIISFDMDQNCFLVYDENKTGVLIDPGFDTFKILKACEGIKITHILLTHCHYDHIFSVNELRGHKKVVCSRKCSENMGRASMNLSAGLGKAFTVEPAEIILDDADTVTIGTMTFKAIATPGHTNCCMCYLVEDCLFAGDTLFRQNVGRWDLPSGNEKELQSSIRNKLYTLPDETKVFCGHGADTNIGYEKKFNFYVSE